MKFANIDKKVLDLQLGEGYDSIWTVKSELERIGEDVLHAEWELNDNKDGVVWFNAWTKSYVIAAVSTIFGDKVLVNLDRNPPNGKKD